VDASVASAKFDATAEELQAARRDAKSDVPGAAAADPGKPVKPKSAKEDAEQGMSALLKAKRRARDELEDR
jgi:hypothetical protein